MMKQQRNRSKPTKDEISRVMAMMGSKGGKIGSKRRMQVLSSERRSQIAWKAARARWDNKKP